MKSILRNFVLGMLLATPVSVQAATQTAPAPEAKAVVESTTPAPAPAPDPASAAPVPEMQFPVMRTIGGMGVVVFLMLGAFFAVKKYAPKYLNKPASQRNMKIIETLGMGDRRSISLVEVGNSRYLVGNTPHQISLLATLPSLVSLVSEPEDLPAPPKSPSKKRAAAPFKNLFDAEKGRPLIQQAAHPLPDDLRVKMRKLRESLERA